MLVHPLLHSQISSSSPCFSLALILITVNTDLNEVDIPHLTEGHCLVSPKPAKNEEKGHWIDLDVYFSGVGKTNQFNDIVYWQRNINL